jgi:hypothetical protein
MLNMFNVFDAKTVTAVYTLTNQSFGYPSDTLDGTVVRFSARYIF